LADPVLPEVYPMDNKGGATDPCPDFFEFDDPEPCVSFLKFL